MVWVTAPGMRWQSVDDDVVVFVPAANGFVELDRSGAQLWQVLARHGWDDSFVVAHLVDTFSMPADQAHDAVASFVEQLRSNGVISPA